MYNISIYFPVRELSIITTAEMHCDPVQEELIEGTAGKIHHTGQQ